MRHGLVGYRAELHKRTLQRGLLSLVGDGARAAAGVPGRCRRPSTRTRRATIAGAPVRVIATDLGVDVLCDARGHRARCTRRSRAAGAADLSDGRAPRCCASSRGRPRYGVDLDDSVIPQEAGLNDRAVSFTKGCYVGQETVARLFYKGKPNRHLRGLRLSAPGAGRRRRSCSATARSGRSRAAPSPPRSGRSGSRSCAARPSPAPSCASATTASRATVVELPFT